MDLNTKSHRQQSLGAKSLNTSSSEETLTTSSNEKAVKKCILCDKTGHELHKCRKFMEKEVSDRIKFVKAERLCFGCLKSGHQSKSCDNRSVCDTCQRRHPTCLHEERAKDDRREPENKPSTSQENQSSQEEAITETISNRVIVHEETMQTAAIIPVWLSSTTQPAREILVYALLDSQSDTTFVLNNVAERLEADKEQVKLKLSTMTARSTVISSQKLSNLRVRGFYSSKGIPLPPVYTRGFIPANRTHIPTGGTARAWPHLEHLQDKIPPLQDCEVGLLIGYNCSQALVPREVVSGNDNQPYAQRTDLGWSIVGCGNCCEDNGNANGISHHNIVRQVKETTPSDRKVLKSDSSQRAGKDDPVPQEDLELCGKERKVGEIQKEVPEHNKALLCSTKAKEGKGVQQRTSESASLKERKEERANVKEAVIKDKSYKNKNNWKVNDIGLQEEDLAPLNQQKLSSITKVHAGSDNRVIIHDLVRPTYDDLTYDRMGNPILKTVYQSKPG